MGVECKIYLDWRSTRLRSVTGCQSRATTVYPSTRDGTCVPSIRLFSTIPLSNLGPQYFKGILGWDSLHRCDRPENKKKAIVEVAPAWIVVAAHVRSHFR